MSNQPKRKAKAKCFFFSERQIISHAITRGLCNRAEGSREGSDKKGRLSLLMGERQELGRLAGLKVAAEKRVSTYQQPQARQPGREEVLWCPGRTAKRMPMSHKTRLRVSSARLPPEVPRTWRGRTSGCCSATLEAERRSCSGGLIWGGTWAGVATSSHIPTGGPVLTPRGTRAGQGTEGDDVGSQKGDL